MGFMNAQVTDKITWYAVDTDCGTWFLPADEMGVSIESVKDANDREDYSDLGALLECTEGREIESVDIIRGYGVRSSAPGYMDRTDWTVYTNKREAMRAYRNECEANE